MKMPCHRCETPLENESNFCFQCGAPQLRFIPQTPAALQESGTEDERGHVSMGSDGEGIRDRAGIQWKSAIQIAALVSLVVGLLSSILAVGSLLWVLGGAMLVIVLYHRRVPYTVLQPSLGARIGVVTGTMTAAIAVVGNTLLLLVQRYGLHQGKLLDATLTRTFQQAMSRASVGAEAQAQMNAAVVFILSPEGRAGMVLLGMAFIALIILILSIAGGVLGARFYRNLPVPR